MHQSFITTAPTYGDGSSAGESGIKVRGSDFLSCPARQGKCRASQILRKYTPVGFTIIKIKNRAMTLSRSTQCRAEMQEKSLSPLLLVGVGGGWGGGSGYK